LSAFVVNKSECHQVHSSCRRIIDLYISLELIKIKHITILSRHNFPCIKLRNSRCNPY